MRQKDYPIKEFTFLGYTFCSRTAMNQYTRKIFNSFLPAVSKRALKAMRKEIKHTWKTYTYRFKPGTIGGKVQWSITIA